MVPNADGLLGKVFGGYRLDSIIGRGATGVVYLGQRVDDPTQQAAVKVLMPPLNLPAEQRAEFRARFRREARTLADLHHAHILAVLDYGEDPATDFDYMVLPYLPGGSLADQLDQRGPLPLAEVAGYVQQIADALDYRIARKAAVPLGHADERACVGFSQKPVPLTNRKQGSSIAPEEESRSC